MNLKTFIIAEAGVNHNGDRKLALRLVEEAKKAGADAVKFQTFTADDLVLKTAPKAAYQTLNDNADSQYEMLKRLELDENDHKAIIEQCNKLGLAFMSTPFSISSAQLLDRLGMKIWKIPSGEITNLPLLRFIGLHAEKIIMSTGMATIREVETAVNVLVNAGADKNNICLLHCTTAYPTPLEQVNLRAIRELEKTGCGAVGLSDHTLDTAVPSLAVAMGATVIEKHLTLDNNMEGPDHKASLNPEKFQEMVENIRKTEKILGDSTKKTVEAEKENLIVARKSIVAATDIKKGETFTTKNLTTKRPATGLSPMAWDELIGHKAKQDYIANQQISTKELK